MDAHLIDIVRYFICIWCIVIAIVIMVRADDNGFVRRITPVVFLLPVLFNRTIGAAVYLVIGSTLETILATAGVGFVLVGAVVFIVFPVFAIIRWIFR